MCEVCRSYPCHPRCPNYEPKQIGRCDKCNETLFEGYELWTDDDGNQFCSEDCAKEYYGIKEVDY